MKIIHHKRVFVTGNLAGITIYQQFGPIGCAHVDAIISKMDGITEQKDTFCSGTYIDSAPQIYDYVHSHKL